ncbi:MAG: SDR family NAD(P)-dependent oxidoreductase [Myxococcota bacterium]
MERLLVTGASRGIGSAAALALARPGRHIVTVSRGRAGLEATRRAIESKGAEASVYVCDLAVPSDVDRMNDELGDLDGIVLNAGVSNNRSFCESTSDAFERELQVNYLSPVQILRHHLPALVRRNGGHVVAVTSLTALVPFPGNATYAASKAAILALFRSLRVEMDGTGVTFGCVLPGYTDTEMTRAMETRAPPMSAEVVGQAVADCYERRLSFVVPGTMNRAAARMFGAFPRVSDALMTRFVDFMVPKNRG